MADDGALTDAIALTDLEVIQRYSLAVRAASADRAELLRVLQADIEWLQRGGRPPSVAPARRPKKSAPRARRA